MNKVFMFGIILTIMISAAAVGVGFAFQDLPQSESSMTDKTLTHKFLQLAVDTMMGEKGFTQRRLHGDLAAWEQMIKSCNQLMASMINQQSSTMVSPSETEYPNTLAKKNLMDMMMNSKSKQSNQ